MRKFEKIDPITELSERLKKLQSDISDTRQRLQSGFYKCKTSQDYAKHFIETAIEMCMQIQAQLEELSRES